MNYMSPARDKAREQSTAAVAEKGVPLCECRVMPVDARLLRCKKLFIVVGPEKVMARLPRHHVSL